MTDESLSGVAEAIRSRRLSPRLRRCFQVVERPFDEALLLRLGHAYQEAAGWHNCRPPLH